MASVLIGVGTASVESLQSGAGPRVLVPHRADTSAFAYHALQTPCMRRRGDSPFSEGQPPCQMLLHVGRTEYDGLWRTAGKIDDVCRSFAVQRLKVCHVRHSVCPPRFGSLPGLCCPSAPHSSHSDRNHRLRSSCSCSLVLLPDPISPRSPPWLNV